MRYIVVVLFFIGTFASAQDLTEVQDSSSMDSVIDNPIACISQTPGFCSIFRSWGFIGDSFCSGEHEYHKLNGDNGYIDLYEYSWGQFICRATESRGDNYSQGGETTQGWIEHFWNNPRNNNNNIDAKINPKQGYIIALGVNDIHKGRPLGDVTTDIDQDYKKNSSTFAGCYAGIIQRIKNIQPQAKIFVVTLPKEEGTNDNYNNVIRQMADIFENVYVIDLYKYAPCYDEENFRSLYFMGGHLNAAGYQYTAWMIMTYIDWIIRQNMQDFEQVGFIGSSYKY